MLSEASEDMYMLSVCRTKQQEEASKSIHAFNTYQEAVPVTARLGAAESGVLSIL